MLQKKPQERLKKGNFIMKRLGNERYPMALVYGISASELLEKKGEVVDLKKKVAIRFLKELERATRWGK